MSYRKVPLVVDEMYHICTKSIAGFKIFNNAKDYERMVEELKYYNIQNPPCNFSLFNKFREKSKKYASNKLDHSKMLTKIVAYCIMPTHLHLVLKQVKENGISKFMNLILKSYSSYFNIKHNRKGPLWESRFRNILVENQEQFLHVTRYIHLNPVTASLVSKPEDWKYSSYREYIDLVLKNKRLSNFTSYLDMNKTTYIEFVKGQIEYQRELEIMKHLTL